MKRVKVIISFAGMSIPHFIEFCRKVAGKMATNTNLFPSPDVALSTIATQTNILEIKYNAAQEGGKQQKLELDLAYKTLLETMRSEGLYVERIANGNEIIITASGFECSKQPITPNHPDFSVDNTDNEGEIILKRKGTAGVQHKHRSRLVIFLNVPAYGFALPVSTKTDNRTGAILSKL